MRILCIKKRGAGYRTIYAPDDAERVAYVELGRTLTRLSIVSCPHAHGFIPGRSPTTCAMAHAGRRWTICADLRDFFDRVRPERIAAGIELAGKETGEAVRLALAACIDAAPRQGLPSSPAAANLGAAELDRDIVAWLAQRDPAAIYTRYADDLSVSSDSRALVDEFRAALPGLCARYGHVVHPGKWQLQDATRGRRVIVGVAIDDDGTPHATRRARRKLRAARHRARTLPEGSWPQQRATMCAGGLAEWCAQRLPVREQVRARAPRMTNAQIEKVRAVLAGADEAARLGLTLAHLDMRAMHRAHAHLLQMYFSGKPRVGTSDSERLLWACKLSLTFGHQWRAWLDMCAREGLSVHDSVHWLPARGRASEGLGAALLRWRRQVPGLLTGHMSHVRLIARSWAHVRPEPGVSYSAALRACKTLGYDGARSEAFAEVCGELKIPAREYARLERRWLRGIARVRWESIPRGVLAQRGKYSAEVLLRGDPRALWAGEYTDCCQHPLGEAATSAWHAATHPHGAVLAVFRGAEIVAQSWLWRSGAIVCADNVECLGKAPDCLPDLYEDVADALVGRLGIAEVRTGAMYTDIPVYRWQRVDVVQPPHGCYSDAGERQVLIGVMTRG